MTTAVVWTGTKCIGIFRHQLSIVSGEFYLAQHFLETIVGATLGVGGGGVANRVYLGNSKTENAARAIHIIRIMLCKLNTIVIAFKIIILLWFQIEHLKACSEVASSRISNWQAFCLQEKGEHHF